MRLIVNGAAHEVAAPGHETLLDDPARPPRPHRNEARLRPRRVRRLHRAARRRLGVFVPHAHRGVRRPFDHDDRRARERRHAQPRASGVHRARRAAMRLLHAGPDPRGRRAARREPESVRRRRPPRHERESLPLRRRIRRSSARCSRAQDGSRRMAKRFVTTKVEIEGREETKIVELPSRNPAPWGEDAELHVVGQRVHARRRAREGHRSRPLHRRRRTCRGCSRRDSSRAGRARTRRRRSTSRRRSRSPACAARSTIDDVPERRRSTAFACSIATIHYAGQPLAAVCADSLEIARRARRRDSSRDRRGRARGRHARAALAPNAPLVRSRSAT